MNGGSTDTSLMIAVNELLLLNGATGVSAKQVTDVVLATLGDWTVKAADYDRVAKALSELRISCAHKLPPGWYAQVYHECRAAENALKLSATAPEEAKGRPDAAEQLAPERLATA